MKENYKAKLIIRGLNRMGESELRDLIIWLEGHVKSLRDEYSKPLPTKNFTLSKCYLIFKKVLWNYPNSCNPITSSSKTTSL